MSPTHRRLRITRRAWLGAGAAGLLGLGMAGGAWLAPDAAAAGPFGVRGHGFLGHGHGHDLDPEQLREGVAWLLRGVDASDAQVERIAAILEGVRGELEALREGHQAQREAFGAALRGERVDRDALDAIRREQLAALDGASQRLVGALADAAEVLTPEQRARLAEEHARFRPAHGWRRGGWRHGGPDVE